MADITKITVGSTTYNLKDLNAVHGTASSSNLGGIKLGYTQSGKNYPVSVDANGRAYVNVPWEAGSGGSALPVQNYQYSSGHVRLGYNDALRAWSGAYFVSINPRGIEMYDPSTGYTCLLDGERLRRLLNVIGEQY